MDAVHTRAAHWRKELLLAAQWFVPSMRGKSALRRGVLPSLTRTQLASQRIAHASSRASFLSRSQSHLKRFRKLHCLAENRTALLWVTLLPQALVCKDRQEMRLAAGAFSVNNCGS